MLVINNPITLYFAGPGRSNSKLNSRGGQRWAMVAKMFSRAKQQQFPLGGNKFYDCNNISAAINLLANRNPALAPNNVVNGAVED